MDENPAFALATERVNADPNLKLYEKIIFHDWAEPDHYQWVATAPEWEILRWVASFLEDD